MAQFGGEPLRAWLFREKMHFHRLAMEERQREAQEREVQRAEAARARRKAIWAEWRRLVERLLE